MQKIWEKGYSLNKQVETYCFLENANFDNKLVKFDVLSSLAHAKMLSKIGVLTEKEFTELKQQLVKILELKNKNQFVVEAGDEDVHSKVEAYLIDKLGQTGKKIHIGRSRNDQVLVDLRLFSKEKIFELAFASLNLTKAFAQYAKTYEFVAMPGYTHMQKAMPSSVGMWAGSFASSLLDDLSTLKSSFEYNDQNPLGSGAAYGVPLGIDRQLTTELLGFSKVQNNSLYAQNSRVKSHLVVAQALVQLMLTLSRFASDTLLFTTAEFNFFSIDKSFSSGSSIMPQKNNLDVLEIMRSYTQQVIAHQQLIASLSAGLISGYNADFATSKEPLIKSIKITLDSLEVCLLVLQSLNPNIKIMEKACSPEIYSTHAAYELAKNGAAFRDAYWQIAGSIDDIPPYNKADVLRNSRHVGAVGNLGIDKTIGELKTMKSWWTLKQEIHQTALSKLIGEEINEI